MAMHNILSVLYFVLALSVVVFILYKLHKLIREISAGEIGKNNNLHKYSVELFGILISAIVLISSIMNFAMMGDVRGFVSEIVQKTQNEIKEQINGKIEKQIKPIVEDKITTIKKAAQEAAREAAQEAAQEQARLTEIKLKKLDSEIKKLASRVTKEKTLEAPPSTEAVTGREADTTIDQYENSGIADQIEEISEKINSFIESPTSPPDIKDAISEIDGKIREMLLESNQDIGKTVETVINHYGEFSERLDSKSLDLGEKQPEKVEKYRLEEIKLYNAAIKIAEQYINRLENSDGDISLIKEYYNKVFATRSNVLITYVQLKELTDKQGYFERARESLSKINLDACTEYQDAAQFYVQARTVFVDSIPDDMELKLKYYEEAINCIKKVESNNSDEYLFSAAIAYRDYSNIVESPQDKKSLLEKARDYYTELGGGLGILGAIDIAIQLEAMSEQSKETSEQ